MRNGQTANQAVLDILSQDPAWAAYAIADLRPDLANHCRWYVAPDATGLALLYHGLAPPILLTVGAPKGVAAALSNASLPPELFLSVLPSHLPAVRQHYQRVSPQKMVRMVLPQGKSVPAPTHPTRRLTPPDANRLIALYQHGGACAPDAFDSGQLNDGYFFGIEDGNGTLAATGGTHIVFRSPNPPLTGANQNASSGACSLDKLISQGVAAIGNIYTRPDRRGQGYGKAVTTSITRALQQDGFSLIVLNVDEQNLVARSIYEKLGFEIHCHFYEGFASKVH